jgi:hypothetical protein
MGTCRLPSVEPVASAAGAAAVVAGSGIGAGVDGGREGSGGGAEELDAVERPQSSADHPWP